MRQYNWYFYPLSIIYRRLPLIYQRASWNKLKKKKEIIKFLDNLKKKHFKHLIKQVLDKKNQLR